jgi:hypothetical protein
MGVHAMHAYTYTHQCEVCVVQQDDCQNGCNLHRPTQGIPHCNNSTAAATAAAAAWLAAQKKYKY